MRRLLVIAIALSCCIAKATAALSPPDIKVLVAKCGATSSSVALQMLGQMNDMMHQSGLANHDFVNAGEANYVFSSTCFGTGPSGIEQMRVDSALNAKRNQLDADLVIMLVPQIDGGGGVTSPGMLNSYFFAPGLRTHAYAMVSQAWFTNQNLHVASHEALHLLGVEHKSGDSHLNRPSGGRANHAATEGLTHTGTAGAHPGDCNPNANCQKFINRMSKEGTTFSNGLPSGNSLHSNAYEFVKDISWSAAAAFRPLPPPPQQFRVTWAVGWCHTCDCTEWNVIHSASNADKFVVQSAASSAGPWFFYSETSSGVSKPHVAIDAKWFRVRAENDGGHTNWEVRYLPDYCDCNTPNY